jgi:hypothetical protein
MDSVPEQREKQFMPRNKAAIPRATLQLHEGLVWPSAGSYHLADGLLRPLGSWCRNLRRDRWIPGAVNLRSLLRGFLADFRILGSRIGLGGRAYPVDYATKLGPVGFAYPCPRHVIADRKGIRGLCPLRLTPRCLKSRHATCKALPAWSRMSRSTTNTEKSACAVRSGPPATGQR